MLGLETAIGMHGGWTRGENGSTGKGVKSMSYNTTPIIENSKLKCRWYLAMEMWWWCHTYSKICIFNIETGDSTGGSWLFRFMEYQGLSSAHIFSWRYTWIRW